MSESPRVRQIRRHASRPGLALDEEEILARADAREAARKQAVESVRRFFIAAWIAGVVMPPLTALAGRETPELEALCWIVVLPLSGMALLVFAIVRRTTREGVTLTLALLSLYFSLRLLSPAGMAGGAIMLYRHAAALRRIAVELDAAPSAVQALVEPNRRPLDAPPTQAEVGAAEAFLSRIRAEGYESAEVGAGFVAFDRDAPFGWGAIYATGLREVDSSFTVQESLGCEPFELRHVGGRWFVYYCSYEGYD